MESSVKINSLELENVKRVKAVQLSPSENGLTIIGGDNQQGKSTVLDAIMFGLGGAKYAPSNAHREGALTDPVIKIELSNGLIVERKGKNSSLKVTCPDGNKGNQNLLDSFIEELALNLPKFMESSSKEKAKILLQLIGVGDTLEQLDFKEKQLYNQRQEIGRIYKQKDSYAKELPFYPEAPEAPVSALELIKSQQNILARNGERQRQRNHINELADICSNRLNDIERLKAELVEAESAYEIALANYNDADKTALQIEDESTAEIEESLKNIELINSKVRTNANRERAEEDANEFKAQYDALTVDIDAIRSEREKLLDGVELPLEGLSVIDGELSYKGAKWDCMSGAEQLIVSTAIVRKLNPKCGFVLMDKLEQLDLKTLTAFGQWLNRENLQVIATRVSQGAECSIIIEDGYSKAAINDTTWKGGTF